MNQLMLRQLWLGAKPVGADHESAKATVRGPLDAMATGAVHPELSVRDSLVLMLHAAAEIEHALLVQYLFTAYSIKPGLPVPGSTVTTSRWRGKIVETAQEEMGHLITVQNALTLLGGPLHFDRDNFPHHTYFYPFPFELERLSIASLSRYIAAEMPDESLIPDHILSAAQLAAIKTQTGDTVNRVGLLYKRIDDAITHLNGRTDLWPQFQPWQADGIEWRASFVRPGDLPAPPATAKGVVASQMLTKADLTKVLRFVATQGESPDLMFLDSHFARFAQIYREWESAKQHDPHFDPVYPIITNPNTTLPPEPGDVLLPEEIYREARLAAGRISIPKTQLWAHLFNLRYRLVLSFIHHYMLLGATTIPDGTHRLLRGALANWTFEEMTDGTELPDGTHDGLGTIRSISLVLVGLPSGIPGVGAGPPFELSYTQALPTRGQARWQLCRELFQASARIVAELQGVGPTPQESQELSSIVRRDDSRRTLLAVVEEMDV